MNATEFLAALAALLPANMTVRDTGAVRISLENGKSEIVYATRRPNGKIVLSYPPKGGRSATYHQVFGTLERAVIQLKAVRS